jgi:hypothetical protein
MQDHGPPDADWGFDDTIGALYVPSSTWFALMRAEVLKISELLAMSDREILALPGIGAVRLEQIKRGIAQWVEYEAQHLLSERPVALKPVSMHPFDKAAEALREAAAHADRHDKEDWSHNLRWFAKTLDGWGRWDRE